MRYNYVFYGATNDFYRHSFADMQRLDNACVRGDFYDGRSRFLSILFKAHTYPQFNRIVELPGKPLWNKHCFHLDFPDKKPVCFILEVKYFGQDSFFAYLRKKFSDCRLVLTFRDQVSKYKKYFPKMNMDEIHKKFDLVMSYDKNDCKDYGMTYFNLEASAEKIKPAEGCSWWDVVFIGRARGRLKKIIEAYDILTDAGLKCFFYVVGAKGVKRHGDIIFTDRIMPYAEMLEYTVNSWCVLELSQEGEYGFTSRSQEAIIYNKKLITDSLIVKEQKFFPSDYILFINDVKEIDPEFVKRRNKVDFGYAGEYSPVRVLEKIESCLP